VSFVPVSEGASNQNLNQLEPNFMYTQIFKEILLQMEHGEKATKDLAIYCRKLYPKNKAELNVIEEFERDYSPKSAIEWYTRECFTYNMLNRALRLLEADTIISMGFFIRDLHQQIQQLHQQQVSSYRGKPFTVYRGQVLLKSDFEKLLKTKGGLMSFNNFLSTSTKQEVSLNFAKGALGNSGMVGILFVMSINPSVLSSPFAAIKEVSYFKTEEEILFSMHTIFRIGEIKQIDNNTRLYQVHLQLTADDDEQLRILTKRIGEEAKGDTGWKRLGELLLTIGQLNKAEELYKVLLEQTSDESEKAYYYHQLGYVKDHQGDYEKAIRYYEKSLEIKQKTLSANHPSLATSYNNIGLVYYHMGGYSKALSFYEKDFDICQKTLPANHPDLATSYNNIGSVYDNMGEYSKALSFYEKSLAIRQNILPANHPNLAASYNNVGLVYYNMGEYSKALSFCEKSFEIFQKTLSANHPDLAGSYNNIGLVYKNMGEYSKALSSYEKSLEIFQKTLPENHPLLATSYNNIGSVYKKMGEYSKALSFYEKDLDICQKTLPANHPDLATSYNNIGMVYYNMGDYSKALSYLERALNIWKIALPADHPQLKSVRESIETVKKKL
jgi:tetratricopeptide (TPR) repeat protein